MQPTERQKEAVFDAFEEHDNVREVDRETHAGLAGEQFNVLLDGADEYDFGIYVEDICLNMEWCFVRLSSGVYGSIFSTDNRREDGVLEAVVEVTRWPQTDD